MFLIISADKGRYNRKINIYKDKAFETRKEAGLHLKEILCGWLSSHNSDSKLLEKLDYDYDRYKDEITKKSLKGIEKQISRGETHIMYSEYDSYEFDYDGDGNLTMISTGCPSDNEYIGETYQVIEIEKGVKDNGKSKSIKSN